MRAFTTDIWVRMTYIIRGDIKRGMRHFTKLVEQNEILIAREKFHDMG